MFNGSIVALITPLQNGNVDYSSLKSLVEWHIAEGTNGIVACGSTGEGYLLTWPEQQQIIETCVAAAAKKIPIIAGTGCISTQDTIDLTLQAEKAGADAVLVVTPAYVIPNQSALFDHFKAVSQATNLPIILYDNPGRTAVKLEDETIYKLAELKNIVGLKDSSGVLGRPTGHRLKLGQDFALLSGEDATTVAYLAGGGNGCISVAANTAPKLYAQLQQAWLAQDLALVTELSHKIHSLNKALFCESNPCPVKYAVSRLGKCNNELRRPLIPISSQSQQLVDDAMQAAGINL